MLSENLKNLFKWLEGKKAVDGGQIILNENEADLLTGKLGGYFGDAQQLERAAIPESLKQPEVGQSNGDNVVRLDHFKARRGDAA